jgi:hypothetical protein
MSRWNREEMYSITYLVRTILFSCLGEVVGVQAGGGWLKLGRWYRLEKTSSPPIYRDSGYAELKWMVTRSLNGR